MPVIAAGGAWRGEPSQTREGGQQEGETSGTEKTLPLHPRQIYHRLAVMCIMNFRLSLD